MSNRLRQLNDAVHGQILLPEICFQIIHTPHFQRLKKLKQLGGTYYVYPGASSNRYEHCIGASYLAGKYGRVLQAELERTNPEIQITNDEIICLQIAGLCHDLGHGPLSHAWEDFMARLKKEEDDNNSLLAEEQKPKEKYDHEDMSKALFDHMMNKYLIFIEEKKVWEFQEARFPLINNNIELTKAIIKSMMVGISLEKEENKIRKSLGADLKMEYVKAKYFLFQIVANSVTGIDVDKFDYLLRDCKALNLTVAMDYRRIMFNTRISEDSKGFYQLAYKVNVRLNIEDVLKARMRMHQAAYQHPRNIVAQHLICDGFFIARNSIKIISPSNPKAGEFSFDDIRKFYYPETTEAKRMELVEAFLSLNDNIIDYIRQEYASTTLKEFKSLPAKRIKTEISDLEKAVKIFDAVDSPQCPTVVGYFLIDTLKDYKKTIHESIRSICSTNLKIIETPKISYCSKPEINPLNNLIFVKDDDLGEKYEKTKELYPPQCPVNIMYVIYSEKKISSKEKDTTITTIKELAKENLKLKLNFFTV